MVFLFFTIFFSSSSGIAEPEETETEKLLTEIINLQETENDIRVRQVYARKDKSEAESIRDAALLAVGDSDVIVFVPSKPQPPYNKPSTSNDDNYDTTENAACDDADSNVIILSQEVKPIAPS